MLIATIHGLKNPPRIKRKHAKKKSGEHALATKSSRRPGRPAGLAFATVSEVTQHAYRRVEQWAQPGAAFSMPQGNTGVVSTFTFENTALTRVPYFDVPLEAEVIGFSPQQVIEVPWGVPDWTTADGHVLFGQAIWVIESDGHTVVVDPCGAADVFLRSGSQASIHEAAVIAVLASSGFPVDSVDIVVMTHLDGIGMVGSLDAEGRWSPLFPNARIVISERELAHIEATQEVGGRSAFRELAAQGVVDAVRCPFEVAPHVTMEQTGGHSPGHCVLRVEDEAVLIGHLAINPVQVSAGVMPTAHSDPVQAFTSLEKELKWAQENNALVIGPLWPNPGAGRVAGPPWVITPAV